VTPQLKVTPSRRKNGLSDAAITGVNLDALGSAEVLAIEILNVDPDYQRDVRHDLVNKIAREYDIVKAGPILVSVREDGTFWVIDGQHRMLGADQAGETEIFAHVVHGLNQAEEADLRLARNDRRSDSIYEKFRTRLVMGDEKAHAMVELCNQQGVEINTAGSNGRHGINSIGTIEMLYDIDGKGVWLARVLRCIREAFDNEPEPLNPTNCSTSMLKSIAWFLAQHVDSRQVAYRDFTNLLGRAGVDDLRRKAVSHKAANGGALWVNFYRAIVQAWNVGRSESKKLRWKTVGSLVQLGDDHVGRIKRWGDDDSAGGGPGGG
jgi:hypothetical protein